MIKYLDIRLIKSFAIKPLLLILFFFFFSDEIEGQNTKRYALNFTDVYVLKVKFDEGLVEKMSYCIYKKKTRCILYRVKVTSVVYSPTHTVYDSTSLMNLQYIIAPMVYTDSLKQGEEYLITAMPSTSKRYIALTRLLDMGIVNSEHIFYHEYAYLSGLIQCKKKKRDLFDDFIKTN